MHSFQGFSVEILVQFPYGQYKCVNGTGQNDRDPI